jgi:tetratricopeptide (TPR) repeat protein
MRGSAMGKFLREHIIETLLGIVVALLGYIGAIQFEHVKGLVAATEAKVNQRIDATKGDLATIDTKLNQRIDAVKLDFVATVTRVEKLECELSTFVVNTAFAGLETEMTDLHLEAKDTVRLYIDKIDKLLKQFDSNLGRCPGGLEARKSIKNFRDGMQSHAIEDFERAVVFFNETQGYGSLPLKFLGISLYKRSFQLENQGKKPEGEEMRTRALRVIEAALSAASQEVNDISKRRSLSSLECGLQAAEKSRERRLKAMECYESSIKRGEFDYATYYNLSRLSALTGSPEASVNYMKQCLHYGGGKRFNRNFINEDGEFDLVLNDSKWGPEMSALIDQFR